MSIKPETQEFSPVVDAAIAMGVGAVGVNHAQTEALNSPLALPEGYHFDNNVGTKELTRLFQAADPHGTFFERVLVRLNVQDDNAGILRWGVGVRDVDNRLIGHGALRHTGDQGELSDFSVSPDHQHQGIGKAIIQERLRLAEAAGLTSLFIKKLEGTNTLPTYYGEKGFTLDEGDNLVRGPRPEAMDSIIADRKAAGVLRKATPGISRPDPEFSSPIELPPGKRAANV